MAKRKLTPKMMRFCEHYVESGNAATAYRSSYDAERMKQNTVYRKSTELMCNGLITARIALLQKELSDKCMVSLETLTKRLHQLTDGAEEHAQFSAAVRAVVALGKLHGLIDAPKALEEQQQNAPSFFTMISYEQQEERDAALERDRIQQLKNQTGN